MLNRNTAKRRKGGGYNSIMHIIFKILETYSVLLEFLRAHTNFFQARRCGSKPLWPRN
jgi:hypothetical protein